MSALGRGEKWAEAYRAKAHHHLMGEAHGYALEVFAAVEAVIQAHDAKRGLEVLAGALAEYRKRETVRANHEGMAVARAAARGTVDRLRAHVEAVIGDAERVIEDLRVRNGED